MKQRLFIFFMIIISLFGINAFAASFEVSFENTPKYLVVAEFSGHLVSDVQVITIEAEQKTAEFETQAEKFYTYLVFDDEVIKAEAKEKTDTEEDLQENVQETVKSFPSVYETEADANRAVMVVKSVTGAEKDGELVSEVKVLIHGEERTFDIPNDVLIESVPESYIHLAGESAQVLKQGDIIRLSATFSGKLKAIALVFRPTFENPLFSDSDYGIGFLKLFSANGIVAGKDDYKAMTPDSGAISTGYGYAYGVIADRENNELILADKNGKTVTVDIADGAIIYTVDKDEKFKAEKSALSVIRKTTGTRSSFDDEGIFIGWNDSGSYNYAFLRTIDGEATEIVIYKNY